MDAAWLWIVLVALVLLAHRWMRTRSAAVASSRLGLHPADVAELNRIARRLVRDHLTPSSTLVRHLCVVQDRAVPVRRIEPTEWEGRWYLGFADGTSVVIAADCPATVLAIRAALLHGSVTVVGVRIVDHGLQLDLMGGRQRKSVLAVADA
ncbi:hypothetical protein [Propioniciclava soli]|uniref:DUF2550 family protein n=1 Tax=Propioniciclava soli TaxID=2775081 RepID=A0ABZ3CA79_9ACTN|nr:hypothetical protein [Propioniciclava soli]